MSPTPIDHYGLHWDKSVAWLHQGRGAANFLGVNQRSPFQVTDAGMCNHLIPVAAPIPDKLQWAEFSKVLSDPLVRAMLPIPNGAGYFVADPYDDLSLYLTSLARLSSPIKPIVKPLWTMTSNQIQKALRETNVQPLVLSQATAKDQKLLSEVAKLINYTPRTVVVTGAADLVVPSPMQRLTTEIRSMNIHDLMTLPLENLGATILRRFARKEDIDAPMESRDERRKRMMDERNSS
jgi:hypothetical protein